MTKHRDARFILALLLASRVVAAVLLEVAFFARRRNSILDFFPQHTFSLSSFGGEAIKCFLG